MKNASLLITATLGALTLPAMAGEFDLYAPSWRGGQYSVQNGWTWPTAPADLMNLPPTTAVAVNGNPPLTLNYTPPWGGGFGSVWVTNAGQPGLMSFGSAYFVFSRWSDPGIGPDPQPAMIRVQFTFDGRAPQANLEAPLSSAQWHYPDPHHAYFDQDIQYMSGPVLHMWNPYPETVLREVRIDTIFVPTPGAAALLAVAFAMVQCRRR